MTSVEKALLKKKNFVLPSSSLLKSYNITHVCAKKQKENIKSTFTGHPLLESNGKSKIDDYKLCRTCYQVDPRVGRILKNIITNMLFKYPNQQFKSFI